MVVQSPKCVGPNANGGVSGDSSSLKTLKSSSPSTTSFPRRSSARIQDKKELLVRRRVELLAEDEDKNGGAAKKRTTAPAVASSNRRRSFSGSDNGGMEEKPMDLVPEAESKKPIPGVSGPSATNLVGKSDHAKIKDTLRLFNKHYLHFVQVGELSSSVTGVWDTNPRSSTFLTHFHLV